MLELHEQANGILLAVRAQPGAKRTAISGVHAGMLKVSVTEPPEAGKANAAIIALLAMQLGIAKSDIQQTAGTTNRQKRFLVQNCSMEQIRQLTATKD